MKKTKIIGILNITPDSFSDGGNFIAHENAVKQTKLMAKHGAEIIDIGAESTRPGAKLLSHTDEWKRLEPVLKTLGKKFNISVDTRHSETAEKALNLGAKWINDVSGLEDNKMLAVLKKHDCQVVLMHNLGIPADPKIVMKSKDVVAEVYSWAEREMSKLKKQGINKQRIIFDPGIGFGKTAEQSMQLIKSAAKFSKLGVKTMIGHSRKSFLKLFSSIPAEKRDAETAVITSFLSGKVDYIRVHNVEVNKAALDISEAVNDK